MPPNTVNLVDDHGNAITVSADEAGGMISSGNWHAETGADVADRAVSNVREDLYGGAVGAGIAAGTSALGAATGGGSDALLSGLGHGDTLRKFREAHSLASALGAVGGAIVDPFGAGSAAQKLGARVGHVAEDAGALRQIAGGAKGAAIEGGIQGVGQTVSDLALSDHPLTAENIASTLSSNLLLNAGVGGVAGGVFKAGEKALARAGAVLEEAGAARKAIQGVPEDLAHLDDAGLKAAGIEAKAAHQADIAAERKSLETLRVEQRAELASQIQDFHTSLATERKIHTAVADDIREKIPGLGTEVAAPLNKSYRTLRAAFDNPIAIAENPTSLLKPLQMQQTALENLQARMPELQAALAGDVRAAALEHVSGALEQNRAFQDAIRQLDKSTPLGGARLSMLEAGPSARMAAIDNAREALKNAPELGLLGKGATGAAFAGVTALAHMIPGVGMAAPFLGKAASDFVGKAMLGLAGAERAVAAKSAATIKTFLNSAEKVEKFVPRTATQVLKAARFGAGPEPKSDKLQDLYAARSAELRSQTMYAPDGSVQMRPEARLAMAKQLDPIRAVNPLLADQIETTVARKIAYQSSKLPRHPEVGGLQVGPDNWHPSEMQMRSWARTVRACEDPGGVEERLIHGNMTPEDAEAYRTVYPERFAALQQAIFQAAPTLSKTLPMKRKIALSIFTGVPCTPSMQPNVLARLQATYATEPGSAGGTQSPTAQPRFGAMGSLKSSDKPTPAQQREGA